MSLKRMDKPGNLTLYVTNCGDCNGLGSWLNGRFSVKGLNPSSEEFIMVLLPLLYHHMWVHLHWIYHQPCDCHMDATFLQRVKRVGGSAAWQTFQFHQNHSNILSFESLLSSRDFYWHQIGCAKTMYFLYGSVRQVFKSNHQFTTIIFFNGLVGTACKWVSRILWSRTAIFDSTVSWKL